YDGSLSFGAFYDDQLVSFTLNGIGDYHGQLTAYDTGTGTLKEHRGKGLAGAIFAHSIPYLQEAGIQQYLLEVLEDNQTAFSIYCQQGFEITRKFDCFRIQDLEGICFQHPPKDDFYIREIDFGYLPEMEKMIDFNLSWQNGFYAMLRTQHSFILLVAFNDYGMVGFGVIEPETGDIPALAVKSDDRRKGIGSALLCDLAKRNKSTQLKLVNIESNQEAVLKFLQHHKFPVLVRQLEMVRKL